MMQPVRDTARAGSYTTAITVKQAFIIINRWAVGGGACALVSILYYSVSISGLQAIHGTCNFCIVSTQLRKSVC